MSGIGRGRGWLNVNKTQRPGLTEPNTLDTVQNDDIYKPQIVNPKYAGILSKISLYNENDDGIMFNRKLKEVIKEFALSCDNAEEAKEACLSIHENCLNDEEFATKTVGLISAASFKKVQIHGVKILMKFIEIFQSDFEGCVQLQANNPTAFRNSVKMLGDFYHKALLLEAKPYRFLSAPVVTYLEMLLDSNNELDLQLFTVQLYMNGNEIKERSPSELNKVLIKIRTILSTNTSLSSLSKLWLLMALDIANNRYNILPSELHQFYLEKLGDVSMARIRKLTTELSIQTTYSNAKLDCIQSNVSVLQPVSSSSEGWESPSSTIIEPDNNPQTKRNTNNSFNNIGTWEQPKNEKQPRPILGAGARAKHDPKNNDTSWRDRKIPPEQQQQQQFDSKKNITNRDNKKNKQKKGWEHDDRFETNY